MKILKIILKVIYNILFVLLLLSSVFIILTSYNVIKGYNFYVVMSGSMAPHIRVGSIVGVKEDTEYNVDDVITIKMKNDQSQTYTHRIVEITEEGLYKTKGDANESVDPDFAEEDFVVGKVVVNIPVLGYLAHFAKQPTGFILLVIVPCIIIITSEINNVREYIKERVEQKAKLKKKNNDEK